MHELMRPAGDRMRQTRPEIIGGLMCKAEDGDYVDTIYVTSDARADDGEKVDIPADLCPPMKAGRPLMDQAPYLDLVDGAVAAGAWLLREPDRGTCRRRTVR